MIRVYFEESGWACSDWQVKAETAMIVAHSKIYKGEGFKYSTFNVFEALRGELSLDPSLQIELYVGNNETSIVFSDIHRSVSWEKEEPEAWAVYTQTSEFLNKCIDGTRQRLKEQILIDKVRAEKYPVAEEQAKL